MFKARIRTSVVERDLALTELDQVKDELDALFAAQRKQRAQTARQESEAGDVAAGLKDRDDRIAALTEEMRGLREDIAAQEAAAASALPASPTSSDGPVLVDTELAERNAWLEARIATLEAEVEVAGRSSGSASGSTDVDLARLRWRNRYLEGRLAYFEEGQASALESVDHDRADEAASEEESGSDLEAEVGMAAVEAVEGAGDEGAELEGAGDEGTELEGAGDEGAELEGAGDEGAELESADIEGAETVVSPDEAVTEPTAEIVGHDGSDLAADQVVSPDQVTDDTGEDVPESALSVETMQDGEPDADAKVPESPDTLLPATEGHDGLPADSAGTTDSADPADGAESAPEALPPVEHPSEAMLKQLEDEQSRPAASVPPVMDRPKGAADDLTAISGIGPRIEEVLHDIGIWSYRQIADWSPEHVAWVEQHLSFHGRITREGWIGQARALL
jgi:predicted flap endonuclease-1-like 5' DNA nuclease/uncharacterized small protein (DUF1192 family)